MGPLSAMLCSDLPRRAGQGPDDPRRAGVTFAPPQVTGGELPELLAAWLEAIDVLQSRLDQALQQPDPSGLVGLLLATVQDHIDIKRDLRSRLASP